VLSEQFSRLTKDRLLNDQREPAKPRAEPGPRHKAE
jgi:hypothetical protein